MATLGPGFTSVGRAATWRPGWGPPRGTLGLLGGDSSPGKSPEFWRREISQAVPVGPPGLMESKRTPFPGCSPQREGAQKDLLVGWGQKSHMKEPSCGSISIMPGTQAGGPEPRSLEPDLGKGGSVEITEIY